jgi:hypothetical protein
MARLLLVGLVASMAGIALVAPTGGSLLSRVIVALVAIALTAAALAHWLLWGGLPNQRGARFQHTYSSIPALEKFLKHHSTTFPEDGKIKIVIVFELLNPALELLPVFIDATCWEGLEVSFGVVLRGEGGGLDGVVAAGFVVDLSDHGFDGDVAIISHVVATVAGVLSVRVLNCEDKLENRALFR